MTVDLAIAAFFYKLVLTGNLAVASLRVSCELNLWMSTIEMLQDFFDFVFAKSRY